MENRYKNNLLGISPSDLTREIRVRRLEELDDFSLMSSAAEIIAVPRKEFSSFGMHAPLELQARSFLLPHVLPKYRGLARLQIIALASSYESHGTAMQSPPPLKEDSISNLLTVLNSAIDAGDSVVAVAAAKSLSSAVTPQHLVRTLSDSFISRIASAAHSHIFLHYLSRTNISASNVFSPMLQVFANELARESGLAIDVEFEIDDGDMLDANELQRSLSRTPIIGRPSGRGIRGILTQAIESELGKKYLAPFMSPALQHDSHAQWYLSRICRVAALAMLQESDSHAKYGWTHCLHLPQAVWSLIHNVGNRQDAVKTASLYVAGFRSAIGTRPYIAPICELKPTKVSLLDALSLEPSIAASAAYSESAIDPLTVFRTLATAASIRTDAHLVKYVLACLDAGLSDREYLSTYMAAAAKLTSLWAMEVPEATIEDGIVNRE